jgi:hypothetical protein
LQYARPLNKLFLNYFLDLEVAFLVFTEENNVYETEIKPLTTVFLEYSISAGFVEYNTLS